MDTWNGRYADRYSRQDGRWAIADRVCVHESTRSEPVLARMQRGSARFARGQEDRGTGAPLGPAAFAERPALASTPARWAVSRPW